MARSKSAFVMMIALILFAIPVLTAQATVDQPASGAAQGTASPFGLGLGLGTETIGGDSWQTIAASPDLNLGSFGIGLDIILHFKLNLAQDAAQNVEIYPGDWIPTATVSFFDLYLPKIKYVRYGNKGEPLFIKLGSIDDGTLGNGFIMGNYSNTSFYPDKKLFGMSFDLDGALFQFPLVGLESFMGNLSQFDVIGGRLYVRPFTLTDIQFLAPLQVGFTVVTDSKPGLYATAAQATTINFISSAPSVFVIGGDFKLPVISSDAISLVTFGDFVSQKNTSGGMIGLGGRAFSLLSYGAQVRFLGPGFVPNYFDSGYDLFRASRYIALNASSSTALIPAWQASLGANFLDGKIVLNIGLDGPFTNLPIVASANQSEYPHLRGIFFVQEGLLAGFSFNALYEKFFLGKDKGFWDDLITPKNAVIQAKINYKTGPATLSLVYDLKYNPAAAQGFDVKSSLQSSIKLF